jgi:hypothetical protein
MHASHMQEALQSVLWRGPRQHPLRPDPFRSDGIAGLQNVTFFAWKSSPADTMWVILGVQGLDDPKLVLQAVPPALANRRFPAPSSAVRIAVAPRRSRFSITSRCRLHPKSLPLLFQWNLPCRCFSHAGYCGLV